MSFVSVTINVLALLLGLSLTNFTAVEYAGLFLLIFSVSHGSSLIYESLRINHVNKELGLKLFEVVEQVNIHSVCLTGMAEESRHVKRIFEESIENLKEEASN